jgi:uncharacterized membrane-anchored protein YhcB (DUF1043 family)
MEKIICFLFIGFVFGFIFHKFLTNREYKETKPISKEREKIIDEFDISRIIISLPFAFLCMLMEVSSL